MSVATEAQSIGVEVETSGMSRRGFEILLGDLRRGPKTVFMEHLRAVLNEGPCEELAPPPFLEAKPMIY